MNPLSPALRRELRARAHALHPVVSISQNGLSETVLKEIDACLKHHELIKIRVYGDERAQRASYLDDICTRLGALPVQHIGKLLVVYRPDPDATANVAGKPATARRNAPRRTKRSFQGD